MSTRTIGQSVLNKCSAQKQLEACHLQLDAALMTGSASDIAHLRAHAHNLLGKVLDLQAEMVAIMKASLP